MQLKEAMSRVEDLIGGWSEEDASPLLFVAEAKQLTLTKKSAKSPAMLVIDELTHCGLSKGLTSKNWNSIEGQLRKLIEEKVL